MPAELQSIAPAADDRGGLRVSVGQYSSAGKKPENQDFFGAKVPRGMALTLKGAAFAIADGISSSRISREAAEVAVQGLMGDYYCTSDAWPVKTAATRVISASNAWLHAQNRRARLDDIDHGRVCTLSALILKNRSAHIFHVGDSRIARLSGASIEPLTEPHRVVISSEQSYLGRAMGAEARVEIDYRDLPLAVGDVFVMTTDGIHEFIGDRDMVQLLREGQNLDMIARRIGEAALAAGSDDNLSVQIIRVDALAESGAGVLEGAEHLPIPPLPKDGDVIDGFRILRPIHANARSHIYLAAAPDGTQVALKIPSMDLREDPAYLRRFIMEEWIARRIDSPHVLHPAAAPQQRSGLYVVTEYIEGETLRQWMTDNPAPDLEQVRDIMDQVVRGLRAFHRREMLHQDLRPENIMIDAAGTVRIIDFGSTYVSGVQEAMLDPDDGILGTAQYTAPEYFAGDPVDWRSDLFSLGVIAYEMLTGRLPYGRDVSKVRSRRDQMRLRYVSARGDARPIAFWIDAALRRAVHPDPMRRYPALSEFVADLRRPGEAARNERHVPLAERDPVRFWKTLSGILAMLAFGLGIMLMTQAQVNTEPNNAQSEIN